MTQMNNTLNIAVIISMRLYPKLYLLVGFFELKITVSLKGTREVKTKGTLGIVQ